MSQPARWLWGFLPLTLLWIGGNLVLDKGIERDVARRAEAAVQASAGASPGARPAFAQVSGRDVTISGEVLSADGASKAMARLRSEPGVRRAFGGLTQVVAQKPYSWFASRQSDAVVIGGFVPDIETADANVAAARAALPQIRVDDRQTIGFGAPEGFAAITKAMIAELPALETGRISLDDQHFCIEGQARTSDSFLRLQALAASPMAGFSAVSCDLQPPKAVPYRWSLERTTSGALLAEGFYPDGDTRLLLTEAIRSDFPASTSLDDRTKPATGAPSAFREKTARAIRDLSRLSHGKASIEDDLYNLTGKGPDDGRACEALKLQIAQEDGPDSVARLSIECPPVPPPDPVMPPLPEMPGLILDDVLPVKPRSPPDRAASVTASPPGQSSASDQSATIRPAPVEPWSAEREDRRLLLKGSVSDDTTRAAIAAEAAKLFPQLTVTDEMAVAAGQANASFGKGALYALDALSRLRTGSVTLRDGALSIVGQAADASGWQSLRQLMAAAPDGVRFEATAETIPVRPYELMISADRGGVRLSGALPDENARKALRDAAADASPAGKLDDATLLAPGAPERFLEAAKTLLGDVMRLDLGTATLSDDRAEIRGLTCRELIASEVETSARTGLPPSFAASVAVSPRQTGCVLDPPASCQNDLDGLTQQNPVLFAQGTAAVQLDPTTERVIGAAAAILQKCLDSRVTIEGHANRDGEWRGFDNRELSLQRAQRVRDELARRGIDPARLDVKGYGIARPLLPHGAPRSREMNRRVQFTVAK